MHFDSPATRRFPIPNLTPLIQSKFERLAKQILSNKSQRENIRKEDEIDFIVYRLYNLNYEEVKLIDPEFGLNPTEYAAVSIK